MLFHEIVHGIIHHIQYYYVSRGIIYGEVSSLLHAGINSYQLSTINHCCIYKLQLIETNMCSTTHSSQRPRRNRPEKLSPPNSSTCKSSHRRKEGGLFRHTQGTTSTSSSSHNVTDQKQLLLSPSSSSLSAKVRIRELQRRICPVTGVLRNMSDDYDIIPTLLGKGHHGIVHECEHRRTRLVYACKSIDKSKIRRFDHVQREIHLLSQINHHGIMKMVDCYEDAERVHIITEKYTGGELFDKISENASPSGCFSEINAARIIKSLLQAVDYLHENDIVHRDIKPENILFESEKEDAIKLIDFGLSRRHEKGDQPMSNPVGTAYYMSPELLKGKYDKSCDIWSIGVVAYILLCGYPPFNGETDLDIFESIERGQCQFPVQAWSTKSDLAKDFIKCLLRRDPRKRFTANEASMHPWIATSRTMQQRVRWRRSWGTRIFMCRDVETLRPLNSVKSNVSLCFRSLTSSCKGRKNDTLLPLQLIPLSPLLHASHSQLLPTHTLKMGCHGGCPPKRIVLQWVSLLILVVCVLVVWYYYYVAWVCLQADTPWDKA